jgi:hypothetical protein
MNLLKLMTVNNPQAHSISQGTLHFLQQTYFFAVFGLSNYIDLQHFYEALQREDGLNILGHLDLSDDLLHFFETYRSLTKKVVKEEFWMEYVHHPQNLFLISRYAIIAQHHEFLFSFAHINPTAEGWHQCMQDLIHAFQNEDLPGSGLENLQSTLPSRHHVLDTITQLKSILNLKSPEFDLPPLNQGRLKY